LDDLKVIDNQYGRLS